MAELVECTGLENRRAGNRTGGSNPSSSANLRLAIPQGTAVASIGYAHLKPVICFLFMSSRASLIPPFAILAIPLTWKTAFSNITPVGQPAPKLMHLLNSSFISLCHQNKRQRKLSSISKQVRERLFCSKDFYEVRIYANSALGNPSRQSYSFDWLSQSKTSYMFFVYVIQSISHPSFRYIGYSANLENRIQQHNSGRSTSTKAYAPFELIFYIAVPSEQKAKKIEQYFKTGSGKAILLKRFL